MKGEYLFVPVQVSEGGSQIARDRDHNLNIAASHSFLLVGSQQFQWSDGWLDEMKPQHSVVACKNCLGDDVLETAVGQRHHLRNNSCIRMSTLASPYKPSTPIMAVAAAAQQT